nr:Chain C, SFTI1 inhibitor GLY-ARG-GLY-THR-LYS-SER-ILE-PRO-PRO-ILE-ALA-PHE-PRO-ASP [Helianthus annuus]
GRGTKSIPPIAFPD